jgi:hypothetical protein
MSILWVRSVDEGREAVRGERVKVSQSATLLVRNGGKGVVLMVSISTAPTRIDSDVLAAAKTAGAAASRSAAQQVSYWARLGKQLEQANTLNAKAIARVLAGAEHYDTLGEFDQAAVRAVWDEQIDDAIAGLNYESALEAAGDEWAEADADGNVVLRGASATE